MNELKKVGGISGANTIEFLTTKSQALINITPKNKVILNYNGEPVYLSTDEILLKAKGGFEILLQNDGV